MRKIYIFGNPDVEVDSLPLKMAPKLQKLLPAVQFEIKDPNEEWDAPEDLIIFDTAMGIKEITVFNNLEKFIAAPRVSVHDFDALANLRLLQKLGKIKKIRIVAIPANYAISQSTLRKCAAQLMQGS